MRRIMTSTALVFAAALLVSGCSAGGTTPTPSADPCEELRVAVRDIANGAQNALSGTDPAATQEKLEGYSERVDEFSARAEENSVASDVAASLDEAITAAMEFVATVPPDGEIDPDAAAERQAAIQEAASPMIEACAE
jgi:hypothetical protein